MEAASSAERATERARGPESRRREAWVAKREVISGDAWAARAGSRSSRVRRWRPSRQSAQRSRAEAATSAREQKTRRATRLPEELTERLAGGGDGRPATRASTSVAVDAE
jgi:hypothetical protein